MSTEETWHPVPAGPYGDAAPPPAARPPPLPFNWFGAQPALRTGRMPFDVKRVSHWGAAVAVGLVLLLMVASLVEQALNYGDAAETVLDTAVLWVGLAVNMLMFIGAPLLWVAVMYREGSAAWRYRLQMRSFHVPRDVLYGVGLGVLSLILGVVAMLVATEFELAPTDNPFVETLAEQLTWPLVFFIAFASSTSEEVFFRGFLQARVGIVVTNLLFGFVHLSYGTPLQVVIPMLLGFLYSWSTLRTNSILPATVGHFSFNFIQLVLAKLCADGVIPNCM